MWRDYECRKDAECEQGEDQGRTRHANGNPVPVGFAQASAVEDQEEELRSLVYMYLAR